MIRTCRICANNSNNTAHMFREMMFGYREEFEYIECSKCGCLQILDIPKNIEKYYPEKYYSLSIHSHSPISIAASYLKRKRFVYGIKKKGILGKVIAGIYGVPDIANVLYRLMPSPKSSILEIGCGAGHLLLGLRECGYSNLTGIDPFIKRDIFYENGVKVFKKNIWDLKEQYNLIILNHSLEHMSDQVSTFKSLSKILDRKGLIIIRIPLVSSFAWKFYGKNWVQIDAPRHLFLHSINSIVILADIAGLKVKSIEYDSNSFQFWGSEQYKRDIHLYHKESYLLSKNKSIFTGSQILEYEKKSADLNAKEMGDQATFYIEKNPSGAVKNISFSGRC